MFVLTLNLLICLGCCRKEYFSTKEEGPKPIKNCKIKNSFIVNTNAFLSFQKQLAMTVTPSFNMRQDIEKRERDLESQRKAEQYHMSKTHKFDVYGKDRQEKPQVNCLDRPVPEKILNTK